MKDLVIRQLARILLGIKFFYSMQIATIVALKLVNVYSIIDLELYVKYPTEQTTFMDYSSTLSLFKQSLHLTYRFYNHPRSVYAAEMPDCELLQVTFQSYDRRSVAWE